MKNSNKDVINFIKNRRISNVIRIYVDRNFRKEYLTYMGYKKTKNDFKAIDNVKDFVHYWWRSSNRNVYQKLLLRTRRNPENLQYEKEFKKFKEDNRKMRDKIDKGKVTYEEYVEWLNGI